MFGVPPILTHADVLGLANLGLKQPKQLLCKFRACSIRKGGTNRVRSNYLFSPQTSKPPSTMPVLCQRIQLKANAFLANQHWEAP